jgi:hypothetical protein
MIALVGRARNPEYPREMLQRPVNDQYDPSFLCSAHANCRTVRTVQVPLLRGDGRAMCAISRSKAGRHRENETHFCGWGCLCESATVRLGDLRGDMIGPLRDPAGYRHIAAEERLKEFFHGDGLA